MTKITLSDVTNPQNLTSLATTINANNAVLETASDNTLSRDGTAPNQMLSSLDMNNYQILNLPAPATSSSPVRLVDVVSNPSITVPPVGTSGSVVGLLNANKTDSGNNTWTGTNTFNNTVSFSSITLPANSVSSSNIVNGTIVSADLANNTVANTNLATMPALTLKGNNSAVTANAADLTVSQVATMLGVLTNVITSKTSAYAISSTDQGSTLALTGGFYAVTAAAASGFPSNFTVRIVNADTTRGKTISLNGLTSFILWPGQSIVINNLNNAWYFSPPGRWIVSSPVTLYVDNSAGNDSNDGLAAGAGNALKTINAAYFIMNRYIDHKGNIPTIQLAAGTYTESLSAASAGPCLNTPTVNIYGSGSSVTTWRPDSTGVCLLSGNMSNFQLSGLFFDNTGGTANGGAIYIHQTGIIDIQSDIAFGTFPGASSAHMLTDQGAAKFNILNNYVIVGSAAWHTNLGPGTAMLYGAITVTFFNTPTLSIFHRLFGSGCTLTYAGVATYSGAITAGCQKYSINGLALLNSSGTTMPGSVAGATANGGVFM